MTFQPNCKYNKTGYDYQEGCHFVFNLHVISINKKRTYMYAYATREVGDGISTSYPENIKIDKYKGHEVVSHPFSPERIHSNEY